MPRISTSRLKRQRFSANQRSLEESHVIMSSYNHSINIRTHHWPYGSCYLMPEMMDFPHQIINDEIEINEKVLALLKDES